MMNPWLLVAICVASFGGGTVAGIGLQQKLFNKKVEYNCPDCNCPKAEPAASIDFDKIRGKNMKLEVHQHYHTEVNGDSIAIETFSAAVKRELDKLKISRCK